MYIRVFFYSIGVLRQTKKYFTSTMAVGIIVGRNQAVPRETHHPQTVTELPTSGQRKNPPSTDCDRSSHVRPEKKSPRWRETPVSALNMFCGNRISKNKFISVNIQTCFCLSCALEACICRQSYSTLRYLPKFTSLNTRQMPKKNVLLDSVLRTLREMHDVADPFPCTRISFRQTHVSV